MRPSIQTRTTLAVLCGTILLGIGLAPIASCAYLPFLHSDQVACPSGAHSLCSDLDATTIEDLRQKTPGSFESLLVYLENDLSVWESNRSEITRMLDAWPDEARQLPASWITRVANQEKLPLLELVKTVSIEVCPAGKQLIDFVEGLDHYGENNISTLKMNRVEFTSELAHSISEAEFVQDLESLDLRRNGMGPEELEYLFNDARYRHLENLDLSNNPLGVNGLQQLAQVDGFPQLTRLTLGNVDADDAGVRALTESNYLKNLEHLDLSFNSLGGDGGLYLSQVEFLNLQSLNLEMALGSSGVEHLVNNYIGDNLIELNLAGNYITDENVRSLVESSWAHGLERLDLSVNYLSPEGIRLVASSEKLSGLRALDISVNQTRQRYDSGVGIAELVESNSLTRLSELSIGLLRVNDQNVNALVNADFFENIEELDLTGNSIRCDGLVTILESLDQGEIRLLRLLINRLFHCGRDFSDMARVELPHLEKLDLSSSGGLGGFDFARLMENVDTPKLKNLELRNNSLRRYVDQLAVAISNLQYLEEVDFSYTAIGNNGVEDFVSEHRLEGLRRLGLSGNGIDDEGVEILTDSPVSGTIESLEINDNEITIEGARNILVESPMTELRHMDFRENPVDISELRRVIEESRRSIIVEGTTDEGNRVRIGGAQGAVCTTAL